MQKILGKEISQSIIARLNALPVPKKIFADSVSVRVINGMQHIAFQSGEGVYCFLLPVAGAKFLRKALVKQVEEIEQKNGIKIDVRLPDEPMLSPWTSKDPEDPNLGEKK